MAQFLGMVRTASVQRLVFKGKPLLLLTRHCYWLACLLHTDMGLGECFVSLNLCFLFLFTTALMTHSLLLCTYCIVGKTIQTIGLLAALLRKKGTGADLLELHRRAQMTEFIKRRIEEAKQEALRNGELYRPTETSSKSQPLSVQQPEWGPVLILAPAAVCKSWMTSFKVWGHFSTIEFASKADLENIKLGSVEILVATHNRIQEADTFACLREIPWKLVIVDEFHVFKNESAIKTKNLRLLRDDHNAAILGLSGTCMQNNHKVCNVLFFCLAKLLSLQHRLRRHPLHAAAMINHQHACMCTSTTFS
jgi:SNF2-related domain